MSSTNGTVTATTVQTDDGVRLNVRLLGDDGTKTKPLLIVLHGAPGLSSHVEPESSFGFLSDQYRVLVYDARGSGKSDLVGPYTHERWVKDVEVLRKWAGAETFVIGGGSYGGFVALEYAVAHGDRLLGIILRGTSAYGVEHMLTALANICSSDRIKPDIARQLRLHLGTLRDDKDFEEAFTEIIPVYAPPKDPSTTAATTQSKEFNAASGKARREFHSATQNAAFGNNLPHYDLRHRLGEIKVPTLVAVGRHDNVAPVQFAQLIADRVPRARLEIFEHSGHSPPSDETEEFRKRISDFLTTEVLPQIKL